MNETQQQKTFDMDEAQALLERFQLQESYTLIDRYVADTLHEALLEIARLQEAGRNYYQSFDSYK